MKNKVVGLNIQQLDRLGATVAVSWRDTPGLAHATSPTTGRRKRNIYLEIPKAGLLTALPKALLTYVAGAIALDQAQIAEPMRKSCPCNDPR